MKKKVLNLYAGVGGNRKFWNDVEVTAVENYEPIAEIYSKLYPNDTLVVGDAHEYLLSNFDKFDFIWSSPPCQSHTKMMKATRHDVRKYPDMTLYQQVILLQHFFKGGWVVENVNPYYEPLIKARKCGRHLFWSNFHIPEFDVNRPSGFIVTSNLEGRKKIMDWLGIHFDEIVYYKGNHCPTQILRNCVHPLLGEHVFRHFLNSLKPSIQRLVEGEQLSFY